MTVTMPSGIVRINRSRKDAMGCLRLIIAATDGAIPSGGFSYVAGDESKVQGGSDEGCLREQVGSPGCFWHLMKD